MFKVSVTDENEFRSIEQLFFYNNIGWVHSGFKLIAYNDDITFIHCVYHESRVCLFVVTEDNENDFLYVPSYTLSKIKSLSIAELIFEKRL